VKGLANIQRIGNLGLCGKKILRKRTKFGENSPLKIKFRENFTLETDN